MPGVPFVRYMVDCPHCKMNQLVHVASGAKEAPINGQTVQCLRCQRHFEVGILDKIVDGPFPV
jgi:hypothetical protein